MGEPSLDTRMGILFFVFAGLAAVLDSPVRPGRGRVTTDRRTPAYGLDW